MCIAAVVCVFFPHQFQPTGRGSEEQGLLQDFWLTLTHWEPQPVLSLLKWIPGPCHPRPFAPKTGVSLLNGSDAIQPSYQQHGLSACKRRECIQYWGSCLHLNGHTYESWAHWLQMKHSNLKWCGSLAAVTLQVWLQRWQETMPMLCWKALGGSDVTALQDKGHLLNPDRRK